MCYHFLLWHWTSYGGSTLQSSSWTATYHPSRKLSKLDEPYVRDTIRDLLLWTPLHGRAKAGRPARTYIQQLCADTECSPEDLPEAIDDREGWRGKVREIRADSVTWWWWWWWFKEIQFLSYFVCYLKYLYRFSFHFCFLVFLLLVFSLFLSYISWYYHYYYYYYFSSCANLMDVLRCGMQFFYTSIST